MRKTLMFVVIIFLNGILFNLIQAEDIDVEKFKIKVAALNYLEGWFEGDIKRMDEALHEKLIKRIFYISSKSGREKFSELGKDIMLKYTKRNSGTKYSKEKLAIEVEVVDRVPHSTSTKIEVKLDLSKIGEMKHELGVIRWTKNIDAGQKAEIVYEYEVLWEKDVTVSPPLP